MSTQSDFAASGDAPSLQAITEKFRQREEQFDGYDAQVTWDVHNPGQSSPLFSHTGNFTRSGNKRRIDVEEQYLPGSKQARSTWEFFTFDGQTAQCFYRDSRRGRVSRDFDILLDRALHFEPQMLGIAIPGMNRCHFSVLLEGAVLVVTPCIKIPKTVTILPRQEIDGAPVWPVQVVLTLDSSHTRTLLLYLAERYDYLPLRLEGSVITNEQRQPVGRLTLSEFQRIRPDLWHPMAGRFELFQDNAETPQTISYRIVQFAWLPDLTDDFFTLRFPPGTKVLDEDTGQSYLAGGDSTACGPGDLRHGTPTPEL